MTRYHRAWMRGKSRYQHDNPGRENDRWQGIIMAYLAEGMTDDKVLSYLDEGDDR